MWTRTRSRRKAGGVFSTAEVAAGRVYSDRVGSCLSYGCPLFAANRPGRPEDDIYAGCCPIISLNAESLTIFTTRFWTEGMNACAV